MSNARYCAFLTLADGIARRLACVFRTCVLLSAIPTDIKLRLRESEEDLAAMKKEIEVPCLPNRPDRVTSGSVLRPKENP